MTAPAPAARPRRSLLLVATLGLLAPLVGVQLASAPSPAVAADPAVSLTHLQVERKTEPVGIDVDPPRFSWVTESDGRGVEQESWRVRVATSHRTARSMRRRTCSSASVWAAAGARPSSSSIACQSERRPKTSRTTT